MDNSILPNTCCVLMHRTIMMKEFAFIALVLLIIGAGSGAYADTPPVLDLDEIIEEARLNNPEIQAHKAHFEAARARISGVRYLMDPIIGIEFSDNMRMYSITQQLPFPTKLSTLSKFASTEAEQFESLYKKKEQEVINKVKKSYAKLFLVYKRIETIEESIAFLKQLFQIASQNYALGKVSQADVLRAQVELAKAENDLLTLKDERKIAEAQLNMLLNRDINGELGIPQEIDTSTVVLDTVELYELAKTNHPELRAFNRMLKKAEVMVSIARQTYFPDFTLKVTQQEMDYTLMDRKFMFGFTLPLWFWGKQHEMVREADAHLKMAAAQYQAMENMVFLEVKQAKVEVDNSRREQVLYKSSIIPQAYASLRSALAAYKANKIDFLSLLESEKTLIQFELEYYRAQTDFFTALADLEEAVGIDREDN